MLGVAGVAALGLGGGGGMSDLRGRPAGACCWGHAACMRMQQCLCHINTITHTFQVMQQHISAAHGCLSVQLQDQKK